MGLFKKKIPDDVGGFSLAYKINVKNTIWLWVREYKPNSYVNFNVDMNDIKKWIFKLYVYNDIIEVEVDAYRFYLAAMHNIKDCYDVVKAVLDELIYKYEDKLKHSFNEVLLNQYLKDN